MALQKELEKMGDQAAQLAQRNEELRVLRKRCEQLEEERASAVGSIISSMSVASPHPSIGRLRIC